jgi:predicted small metal-binding protein
MVLRCDCGFRARGECEAELVAAAQNHARDAHGTDVGAEVVAGLLRSRGGPPSKDSDSEAP